MTLGETLRDAREKKGIALDQAGEDTRIREKFLRALEADDWQSLPGAVYTRGFLRNYGEYLALDIEELMAAFQSERPLQNDTPQRLDPIKPIERGALIFTPKLVVPAVIAAGVVIFVGWLYYQFVSFAELGHKRLQVAEVIRIVGITHDHVPTARGCDAGPKCIAVPALDRPDHASPMRAGDLL